MKIPYRTILYFVCSFFFSLIFFWEIKTSFLYQLFELEHNHLALVDWTEFCNSLVQYKGLGLFVSRYFIQYFAFPLSGPIVFVFPFLIMFVALYFLLRRTSCPQGLYPLFALSVILQLYAQYDFDYNWMGSLSFAVALLLLGGISSIKQPIVHFLSFILSIPLLGWFFGPIVLLYTLLGLLLDMHRYNFRKACLLLPIPLVECVLFLFIMFWGGFSDSLIQSFSPQSYYNPMMDMPFLPWLSWGFLLFMFAGVALFTFKVSACGWLEKTYLSMVIWCLFILGFHFTQSKFINADNQLLWRLNHDSYVGDWDDALRALSENQITNQVYMNYAFLAMAHQGTLGDKAFEMQPYGVGSLMVTANSTGPVRMLMSDICYSVGCIAEAQQHAFEAQTSQSGLYGIQTLKRLVQTNLIQGHYAVAEKYIALIEKTSFHKDWAAYYRQFLYHDERVIADKELGFQRRNLSKTNRFAMFQGWVPELEDILESNPNNRLAALYLGLSYLLGKDMEGYHRFLDRYYGTQCLPELPLAFQQGVVALYQQEKSEWERYDLSPETKELYGRYRDLFFQTRNNPNQKNIMQSSFYGTFWYYLMYI